MLHRMTAFVSVQYMCTHDYVLPPTKLIILSQSLAPMEELKFN